MKIRIHQNIALQVEVFDNGVTWPTYFCRACGAGWIQNGFRMQEVFSGDGTCPVVESENHRPKPKLGIVK
jgi:hypothetical protein